MDIDAILDRIRQSLAAVAVAGIACGSAGCATRLPGGIVPTAFQTTAASPVPQVQETKLSDLIMACAQNISNDSLRQNVIKRLHQNWKEGQKITPEMAITGCRSAIKKEIAIKNLSTPSKTD